MRRDEISQAKEVAQRFLLSIEAMELRERLDEHFRRYSNIVGFKETAAVRRASLDLTRALAKMRKP